MVNPNSLRPYNTTLGPAAGPTGSKILAPPLLTYDPKQTTYTNNIQHCTLTRLSVKHCWSHLYDVTRFLYCTSMSCAHSDQSNTTTQMQGLSLNTS